MPKKGYSRERITRRRFLSTTLWGSAALFSGWPRRASWAKAPGASHKRARFLFYTDIHARVEWDTPKAMARAAAAMNALDADFVIVGGDLITDGFQSTYDQVKHRWGAYMNMHESIRGPIYPVLGNHDVVAADPEDGGAPAADPRAVFREYMGLERTYWDRELNGIHLIVLDSLDITGGALKYQGRIDETQFDWLANRLTAIPKDRPIVLASHIPLLTAFYQATRGATVRAPKNRVVINNESVLDLFRDHNLPLVLQGHLHVNELLRWRGTTFITGGAVCAKWWRGPWHGTEEGFGVVTFDGDRVDWEYVEYDWEAKRPPHV